MIQILKMKEALFITGAGFLEGLFKHENVNVKGIIHPLITKSAEPNPPPAPTCSCLDYNDREFPMSGIETMNVCWGSCCKDDHYHAAKFGKYPRDC